MAKARLDVLQSVVLLRRRAQRLREQCEIDHSQRQLATPRADRDPIDPDQVSKVEVEQPLHPVRPEVVDARLELDLSRAVDEVEERHLALPAPGGEAAGDAV